MPKSQRQRAPSPNPIDIEADINSKLMRLERDGGLRPPPKLQVTTQLHPFWHTKRGMAVIVLVVLVLIGAIVGGVIGGTKGSKRVVGTPPTSATSTSKSTANTTTSTSDKNSSTATKTDSVTTLTARAYPIRREALYEPLPSAILSLAGFTPVISPAMVVQAEPTMISPPC